MLTAILVSVPGWAQDYSIGEIESPVLTYKTTRSIKTENGPIEVELEAKATRLTRGEALEILPSLAQRGDSLVLSFQNKEVIGDVQLANRIGESLTDARAHTMLLNGSVGEQIQKLSGQFKGEMQKAAGAIKRTVFPHADKTDVLFTMAFTGWGVVYWLGMNNDPTQIVEQAAVMSGLMHFYFSLIQHHHYLMRKGSQGFKWLLNRMGARGRTADLTSDVLTRFTVAGITGYLSTAAFNMLLNKPIWDMVASKQAFAEVFFQYGWSWEVASLTALGVWGSTFYDISVSQWKDRVKTALSPQQAKLLFHLMKTARVILFPFLFVGAEYTVPMLLDIQVRFLAGGLYGLVGFGGVLSVFFGDRIAEALKPHLRSAAEFWQEGQRQFLQKNAEVFIAEHELHQKPAVRSFLCRGAAAAAAAR